MFQAVVAPGKRSNLDQHYTSVPDILRTIEPLFIDKLKEEFDKAYDSAKKLDKLLDRIARIRVFETFMPRRIHTRVDSDLAA